VQGGSHTHNQCVGQDRAIVFRVRRVDGRKTCDEYSVRVSNGAPQ
jgi:hypothetical protein